VANASFIDISNQPPVRKPKMPSPKSLTLHSQSFSDWGSDHLTLNSPYKGCEYVGNPKQQPNHLSITNLTSPKRLMLYWCLFQCIFYLNSATTENLIPDNLHLLGGFLIDWGLALWQLWTQLYSYTSRSHSMKIVTSWQLTHCVCHTSECYPTFKCDCLQFSNNISLNESFGQEIYTIW